MYNTFTSLWTLYVYVCSVIDRSWSDDVSLSDSDGSPHWCRMALSQNAPGGVLTNGNESGSSMPSEPGATVKSLIKSFDTAVPSEDTTFLAAFLFPLSLPSFSLLFSPFFTSFLINVSNISNECYMIKS